MFCNKRSHITIEMNALAKQQHSLNHNDNVNPKYEGVAGHGENYCRRVKDNLKTYSKMLNFTLTTSNFALIKKVVGSVASYVDIIPDSKGISQCCKL